MFLEDDPRERYYEDADRPHVNAASPLAFYLLALLLLALCLLGNCSGCNPTPVPTPAPTPEPSPTPAPLPEPEHSIVVPPLPDQSLLLAYPLSLQIPPAPNPAPPGPNPNPNPDPGPYPGPKVGDTCPICDGKGQVGDGVIVKPCKDCRADGRVDPGDPILSGDDAPLSAPASDSDNPPPTPPAPEPEVSSQEEPTTDPVESWAEAAQPSPPQYRIRYGSSYYYWNYERQRFIQPQTGRSIRLGPSAMTPAQGLQYVSVCLGNRCQLLPVERLTHEASTSIRP